MKYWIPIIGLCLFCRNYHPDRIRQELDKMPRTTWWMPYQLYSSAILILVILLNIM